MHVLHRPHLPRLISVSIAAAFLAIVISLALALALARSLSNISQTANGTSMSAHRTAPALTGALHTTAPGWASNQSFCQPAQPSAAATVADRAPLATTDVRADGSARGTDGTSDDYYQVLDVPRDASTPEIRRAYRGLSRQHHPDRNPKPDGPERFRTLAEAYAVLNDPARRARYDHITKPPARRDPPRATPVVLTRRGVLELSAGEARLAATMSLTLITTNGMTIALPAGLADGDQITIATPEGPAMLTVRVNFARRT